MNAPEWEKLRKNWEELCDVYPSDVLLYLYQENIIDYKEKEKIQAAETRSEQMERLLKTLRCKEGKQPFLQLLKALSQKKYISLVMKIEETFTTSDPTLKASADPSDNRTRVRDILRKYFTEEAGTSTTLQEIREVLNQEKAFPDGNEWKNDLLCTFLGAEFVSIETQTAVKNVRGKNRKFLNVVNLKKIAPATFLEPNENDSLLIPGPTIAKEQVSEKLPTEHPRILDQDVTPTLKYKLGHCFPDILTDLRGPRMSAIKNYHLIECKNTDEALEQIGFELVPFASACMNERRNGIIYFGVSPSGHSKYTGGEIVGVSLDKKSVQEVIQNYLHKCFLETQNGLIKKVVREPKFIPLIKTEMISAKELAVIEIDIIPSQTVMDKEIIKTKLCLLPQCSQKMDIGVFRFSEYSKPKLLTETERDKFERELQSIIEQRKEEESKIKCQNKPNLRDKLLGLLTGGSESLVDDVYPFLITSEIDSHMDQEYLLNNMPFIKYLQPEVVFDFDPKG
ncbi:Sterile alpha motif domain-containing protein 9-like [Bulinus truncatus]|nr:Sterile alpha motif domain-containing protein 9-like [Bulinus truncatus]